MKKIIGIVGFIGSGKDTVSNYLETNYNYKKESFAASLKDVLTAIFGWDREMLEGSTIESRAWRNEVDTWWATKLGIPGLTPRMMMQNIGTDILRKHFSDNIWIASLERKLLASDRNIVISDCRFPNEIDSVKKHGGEIIWVQRGNLPYWYTDAKEDLQNNPGIMAAKHSNIHISEWAWVGAEVDSIIHNDSTLATLYDTIATHL